MTRHCAAIAFILALGAGGTPLAAQAPGLSFTPFLGVYVPAADAARIGDGTTARQEASIAVGGRIHFPVHGRFGFEVAGDYAPSDLRILGASTEQVTGARVLSGAAKATYSILRPSEGVDLQVNGGAAVIHHGGAAYSTREHPTRLGGVFGVSAGLGLGGSVRLQVGVEDYIYRSDLTPTVAPVGPVPLASEDLSALTLDAPSEYRRTQHDVHLTVGLAIR